MEEDDDLEAKLAALQEMKDHIGVSDDEPELYTAEEGANDAKKRKKGKGGGGGGGMGKMMGGGGGMDISSMAGMIGG